MVRDIHEIAISEDYGGGKPGEKTSGDLESILHRVPNNYHYGEITDVLEIAAMYGVAISKGHAFEDGNKRTAFISMNVFLLQHGWKAIALDRGTIVDAMVKSADGKISEKQLYDIVFESLQQSQADGIREEND